MNVMYLPQAEFGSKNKFFYNYYTADAEYIYHDQLQYHDFYEIQLFKNKAEDPQELLGYITLDGQEIPLYHNTLLLIDMFKQHKIEIKSKNYIRICFDISPNYIYFASSKESNLLNLFKSGNPTVPLLRITEEQGKRFMEVYHTLNLPTLTEGLDIYEKGLLFLLLANLFDISASHLLSSSQKEDKSVSLIHDIIQYIDEHIENQLSLDELSEALHFSTYYLCHVFKESTNLSLKTYITDKKIELAKHLLAVYPVTEVAEKIGFNSYSSFFRTFKKLNGISPSDYKTELEKQ